MSRLHRTAYEFLLLLIDRFRDVRCQQVAASLTFTTLLSLVPLLTVSLVLISNFPVFDTLASALRSFLLDNMLPQKAGDVIAKYTLQFSQKASQLTLVGMLLLVVTLVITLMTIDRTLNAIFRVARPQKIWRRIVVYWVVVSLGPLLLGAGIAGVTYVVSASLGAVNEPLWVRSALFRSMPMLLLAGLLTFLYSSVPNRPIQLRHALAGGVFATFAFALLQKLFGLYISKFPTYTLIYGAFATVPIFLLWLYLSWTVVLLGALITAVLPEFLWGRRSVPRRPGREVVCALLALRALGQAQRKGESRGGLQLAAASRQTESEVELMLERMRDAEWVAQTDEGDWMLARRLEDLSLADVFERFAFSPLCAAGTGTADDIDLRARLLEAYGNAAEKLALPLSRLFD